MRPTSMLILAAALACVSGAAAQDLTAPAPAYLIDLPASWDVRRGEALAGAESAARASVGRDAGGQTLDLRAHPPDRRDVEVNVVLSDEPVQVNEQALAEFRTGFVALMRDAGAEARVEESRIQPVGGRSAILLDVSVTPSGLETPRRQWTVAVPARASTLVLTFRAPVDAFPEYEAAFASILGSVSLPGDGGDVRTLENWYVRGAVLAGVAILVAGVFVFTGTRGKDRDHKLTDEERAEP